MKSSWQFRLQSLFLLVFCAALGLTISGHWLGALESTFQVAVVIGLLQQAWQLAFWQPPEKPLDRELNFARQFGIVWRVGVSITLAACLLWLMRKIVQLPERNEMTFRLPFQDGLAQLCVLVALCNTLIRWQPPRRPAGFGSVRGLLLGAVGLVIAATMLIGALAFEYLFHLGMHGIELRQKPRFRRHDLYVPLSADDYAAIWFGLVAITCLFVAMILFIRLRNKASKRSLGQIVLAISFAILLIPPTAFCVWYHRIEFHRLSPELAVGGFSITSPDLVCGALVAVVAATIGAYKVAAKLNATATITPDLSVELDRRAFHESTSCLLILALCIGVYAVQLVVAIVKPNLNLGSLSVFELLSDVCAPIPLLIAAEFLAAIQVCRARWRNRQRIVPWTLNGLSPERFTAGWLELALLMIVGIPTIRAMLFLLWLGPYNIPQLYGF